MRRKIYNYFKKNNIPEIVFAHCDIPCKIYDPIIVQIGVVTMLRLADLIEDLDNSNSPSVDDKAQFNRLVNQKEEHGIRVKEEIRVIWGDYFKKHHFEEFPELHDLTHSIMIKCSNSKQIINKDCVIDLLDSVNRFAEIFWHTKKIKTFKAKCPYPPGIELVYPNLN